jgi:hypothetical protein
MEVYTTLRLILEKWVVMMEMDATVSGSRPMVSFDIRGAEPSGSAIILLAHSSNNSKPAGKSKMS